MCVVNPSRGESGFETDIDSAAAKYAIKRCVRSNVSRAIACTPLRGLEPPGTCSPAGALWAHRETHRGSIPGFKRAQGLTASALLNPGAEPRRDFGLNPSRRAAKPDRSRDVSILDPVADRASTQADQILHVGKPEDPCGPNCRVGDRLKSRGPWWRRLLLEANVVLSRYVRKTAAECLWDPKNLSQPIPFGTGWGGTA